MCMSQVLSEIRDVLFLRNGRVIKKSDYNRFARQTCRQEKND